MWVNSNSLNGIVIIVLGMSAAFIGTWWYPFLRSLFEKWVHPAALAAKFSLLEMGLVSRTVQAGGTHHLRPPPGQGGHQRRPPAPNQHQGAAELLWE
jgi:hypothetical protein